MCSQEKGKVRQRDKRLLKGGCQGTNKATKQVRTEDSLVPAAPNNTGPEPVKSEIDGPVSELRRVWSISR